MFEILILAPSSRYSKNSDEFYNLKLYEKIKNKPIFKNLLEENYLEFFRNIYYKSEKRINLKKYTDDGRDEILILSDNIKTYKDKVEKVSTTDDLTGLHNRKYLQERLEEEISRSRRYGTKLSCILFDIDFFKVVNDMYGYEWGDILLRNIANKLSAMVRKEDILTRYGDEEFLLVLPNTSEENAFLFGERFRREVEKMEFIPAGEEEAHRVTISGGISTYPCMQDVEEDANTVIRYAEHALYNAKHRGKNKIIQFSQMNLEM